MIPNKNRGYYSGRYNVAVSKYSGEDFSRKCFIFPGQGSATEGMFKEQYLGFEMIRKKFEQADLLAKKNKLQKISDYILNPGNIEKAKLPIIRNLALFTMEVALHEVLVSKRIVPKIITGYSFGEYAALVACGSVSFEEMFEIVYYRDSLCPQANSLGFMIAVGADEDEVKTALRKEEFYVSNLNSHQQTVVSVSPGAIDKVTKSLKENNIDYKILEDVPQPYHSPYLDGIRDEVEKYIESKKIDFRKPQIPLFSSVVYKLIDKDNFKEEDIRHILINQITTPVNFIFQISSIYDLRCFNFIELNEKITSSAFVRNILVGKEFKTDFAANILKSEKKETPKYISAENSKLFSLVSRVIGEITGYEIEKISFEDRYQEDLGIDSIKKADILLTVLSESEINPGEDFNTSSFGSIKDTVEYLKNTGKEVKLKEKPHLEKKTLFGRYVFAWEEESLDDYFLMPNKKDKYELFKMEEIYTAGEKIQGRLLRFFEENQDKFPNIIISAEYEEIDYDRIILFFKFWRDLLQKMKTKKFNLVLASSGKSCPCNDGYASFFKSMKKELPDVFFKHIYFEDGIEEKKMLDVVSKEIREPFEIDILYKKERRLVSVRKDAKKIKNKFEINEKSVVLAIGGAKGITFSLIKNISKKYKPVIFLVGKSLKEDEAVQAHIKELEKNNPNVHYESLDARDENSLEKLFSKIKNKHKKIDMVLNAAGTVNVSFIQDKNDEEMERELSSKLLPAINVLKFASKYDARKVINFSSIISKYGSAGQSIYTMANEMIAGLTVKYDFGSIVHWPPWDGVGMTQQQGILRNLNEHGVSLLKPEKADELFSFDLVSCDLKAVYYMDKDDDALYGFSLNDFGGWEALLGKLMEPFNISAQNQVFEKIFDLSKDSYLKDHQIEGTSYVPAAVGIVMFLCLAKLHNKKFPILENIVIHNPIIVKDELLKCFLEIENKNGVYDFSLKTNVLNSSCQIKNIQEEKIIQHAIAEIDSEILIDSFYSDYYFKDSLYLGPIFQSINRAFLDKDGNPFFRVDNSKLLPILGYGVYDKLIQWVDVSFQALSAIGLKNNYKFIPVNVSELTTYFHNEISDYLYVIPSITQFDSKDIRGDVVIVNENKEVILEMKGVSLKSINRYEENRLKIVKYEGK